MSGGCEGATTFMLPPYEPTTHMVLPSSGPSSPVGTGTSFCHRGRGVSELKSEIQGKLGCEARCSFSAKSFPSAPTQAHRFLMNSVQVAHSHRHGGIFLNRAHEPRPPQGPCCITPTCPGTSCWMSFFSGRPMPHAHQVWLSTPLSMCAACPWKDVRPLPPH